MIPPDEEEDTDTGVSDESGDSDIYFTIEYEQGGSKYDLHYKKGKYRTVVILFEGKVVATPYDEQGPKTDKEKVLVGSGRISHSGEIK